MGQIKNILWISFEDTSPRFGCYGDSLAQTPHVDALAAQGRLWTQATSTASICGPSRASIITGMYAPYMGCQHMRTTRTSPAFPELPTPYEAVPPSYVKGFPEYLRAAGFFCTNNSKTDYQFGTPQSMWDLQGGCIREIESEDGKAHLNAVHWRQRPNKDQPFFAVFNLGYTHESGQFAGARGRVPEVTDPSQVSLPAYLPDTPAGRQSLEQQYNHIAHNDAIVGHILQQLEDDGLADETAVFIWSDHAEGLPRRKSWSYFAGCHVPLIIRAPGLSSGIETGVASLIDLGPTVLSLLGMVVPAHMQGRPLVQADLQPTPSRDVVFAHRDRIGESYDRIRSAFDQRFSYIRNNFPQHGRGPYQAYRHKHPIFQEMYRLEREGRLTGPQRWLFDETRPVEELYDRQADPDEVHNLANDPAYAAELQRLSDSVDQWENELGHNSVIDEAQMVRAWYPDGEQPVTAKPIAVPISPEHHGYDHLADESLTVTGPLRLIVQAATQGASVEISIDDGPWQLCGSPLTFASGTRNIRARAIRYGYRPSAEAHWQVIVR